MLTLTIQKSAHVESPPDEVVTLVYLLDSSDQNSVLPISIPKLVFRK
jgi:hypothetical protein